MRHLAALRAYRAPEAPAVFAGYDVVQQLSHSDFQTLLRARRTADGCPVLLKLPPARTEALGSLERERKLLETLSIAGVPKAIEICRNERGCALVLEDSGGLPLSLLLSSRFSLERVFRIAIQLAAILAELHRHEIVHKHVAPESILVNPKNDEVSLIDLRLASRRSNEGDTPPVATMPREALAYLSPEQTGRMNREVDYRSDFYSLGIVLYELLTGRLPFASSDPLELVHAHLARLPPSPADLDPQIPEPVSRLVMRLIAKTAEERYQSALGLRDDLECCEREWSRHGRISLFPLGRRDVSDRFLIPQKLYGREREAAALLEAFEKVCRGRRNRPSMFLVSGYSGIGKTSLINELYKPIVRERGYFVSGKFDQVVQSVPFGALIQAMRGLLRQLLAESEQRLALCRERVADALGSNGGVIAEVIPEIELIIGPQPLPIALGSVEAQNRFQLVFQKFVGALARKEHPLVVFLDDLQWADSATLNLLSPLLTSESSRYLFLMGAYRDNEVDPTHALARTFAALERAGVELSSVSLGALSLPDLTAFVRDVLRSDLEHARPLSQLVAEKTGGNPFFAIQFMKALHQEGFLDFDYGSGRWTYRIEEIAGASMTDNVIDLMTRRIQKLSPRARRTLTLAACIGNEFDCATLALVSQESEHESAKDLEESLELGLVLASAADPASPFKFLHDRVQHAAYALIPVEKKASVHLTVGRLLRARIADDPDESRLFDVVQHLNLGAALIEDRAERQQLSRLNLSAGRRAKSSTAFDAALGYFELGISLLPADAWQAQYELAFALRLEQAECLNLCGRFDQAEQVFELLLTQAKSPLEKARVHSLRLFQHERRSRFAEAVAVAREALLLFGVSLPESEAEKEAALERDLAEIRGLLAARRVADLVDLPTMSDPGMRMVMSILMIAWSPAYVGGDQPLSRLISSSMVRLSLSYGNCEESAYGYATHAITVGPLREDYEAAFEFGSLAMRVNERFDDARSRAKIVQQFHAHANLWRRPLSTCIEYAREATRSGLETGDLTYAIYGAFTATWVSLMITPTLEEFRRQHEPDIELFRKHEARSVGDAQRLLLNWARALRGEAEAGPTSLSGRELSEQVYAERYRDNPFFTICLAVTKLELCYLFRDSGQALDAARLGRKIIHHLAGSIWPPIFEFWNALVQARLLAELPERERENARAELTRACASYAILAKSCPENYEAGWLLLEAEAARADGRVLEAFDFYERAIQRAEHSGPAQLAALAHELCGETWLARGQRSTALAFLAQARAAYAAWGARAKVVELERRHPDLDRSALELRAAPLRELESLDLGSAVKAALAVAAEVELEKLLGELLRIAIENAGAERGSLILELEGEAFVHASGSAEAGIDVHGPLPLESADGLATSAVNYVRRTLETIVLQDARTDDRFRSDAYVAREAPRSLLCVPVLHKGRLIGCMYLENNLAAGAFTAERTLLSTMLASQAAIAIENARHYRGMKQEIERRGLAEDELRRAVAELETLKNRLHAENAYLQEEIRHEHNFQEMVGGSRALVEVLQQIELLAPTDSTVLVVGETGTGKELVVRAIHDRSSRKGRPLVKVNCGAISAGLVESELFGHVKGAFTGALDRRVGRFELADRGTLFLDEVGELPLETQVKLLRVLQEAEFEAVGSSKTQRVDVRIIAATNRNLEEAVRVGRFRADLFYRLNVLRLDVPPLRERDGDLPQLVMFFAARFAKKFGRATPSVTQETLDQLAAYDWPGNIRELGNVIERAVVLSRGSVLTLAPGQLPAAAAESKRASQTSREPPAASSKAALREVERGHILAVLDQTGGVVEGPRGAAAILQLHPNTLRSRMKKLGIR